MELGDQLRQLRYKKHLNREHIYMEIEISNHCSDKIEAGYNMHWGNICFLAKFYDNKAGDG